MSLTRKAPRRDGNEAAIITEILMSRVPRCGAKGCRCGVSVQSLSGSPGLPDLLVGVTWDGGDGLEFSTWELVEVKNPEGKGTKLTKDQEVWHKHARGKQAFLLESPDDVPALMGTILGLANVVPMRRIVK